MTGIVLSIRNNTYELGSLKKAFHMFMAYANPTVKARTVTTYCSDAFFILEQLPEKWISVLVLDKEHSDSEIQAKLQTYIRNDITGARTCPEKDARSYTKHFWKLIIFLRMLDVIEEGRLAMPRRIGE